MEQKKRKKESERKREREKEGKSERETEIKRERLRNKEIYKKEKIDLGYFGNRGVPIHYFLQFSNV